MSYQHRGLAAGRWKELSLVERMANIGSEVERAITWKEKGNQEYSRKAFERALELIDVSLDNCEQRSHVRELARVREALVDYFDGQNEFKSTGGLWKKYFLHFAYAARRNS